MKKDSIISLSAMIIETPWIIFEGLHIILSYNYTFYGNCFCLIRSSFTTCYFIHINAFNNFIIQIVHVTNCPPFNYYMFGITYICMELSSKELKQSEMYSSA